MHRIADAPLGVVTQIPPSESCTLIVPRSDEPIVLDGKLDEPVWKKAACSTDFKENRKGGVPQAASRARAFHDAKGLYIGYECDEPCMNLLKPVDNPMEIAMGDVVELFLVPSNDTNDYFQFLVNPNGVGKEIRSSDSNWKTEWRRAAFRNKDSWTAEIFIPWQSIGNNGMPGKGEVWRGNFCRERYPADLELSAWSPTGDAFAIPMLFGRLQFMP